MEPLKFNHIYFDAIWGGYRISGLQGLRKKRIGQTWDISCHKNGKNIIETGFLKGKTLETLHNEKRADIFGDELIKENFPLHIAILDAMENLSVQVHPKDSYGYLHEGESGKTEAWYILECEEGATLIAGTKAKSSDEFFKNIKNGDLSDSLSRISVNKGNLVVIESGLVHGLGKGILAIEISQNCDTTYRVYDYNRGRELHVQKGLDVIDVNLRPLVVDRGVTCDFNSYTINYLYACKYFSIEIIDVKTEGKLSSDKERFHLLTCIDGNGTILWNGGETTIAYGETVMIPAYLGNYSIKGRVKLIRSYKPNINRLKKEVIERFIFEIK